MLEKRWWQTWSTARGGVSNGMSGMGEKKLSDRRKDKVGRSVCVCDWTWGARSREKGTEEIRVT